MKGFDDYFFEGSSVLANKLGVHNPIDLDAAVNKIVFLRQHELLAQQRRPDCFDSSYLRHVHRMLFQDCYDWAGEYRECGMGRNIDFCSPEEIPGRMDAWSRSFQKEFMSASGPSDQMADRLAGFWGALNQIHPFRDGNGRSQAAFFVSVCDAKGLAVSFSQKDIKNLRLARDEASDGRTRLLENLLRRSLSGEAKPYGLTGPGKTGAFSRLMGMLRRGPDTDPEADGPDIT